MLQHKTKFVIKAMALLMCTSLILPIAACSKQEKKENSIGTYGTVWSAPSTVKIQQDDITYADKGPAELNYNVVKNEYESQQLLITATKEVEKYDIEIDDLTCDASVLKKENITVYNERYIALTESFYGSYIMPDALIPLDVAREHNELTIKKNNNAALWITIYIPEDTPAGLYKGSFKLTVEDVSMDIPVNVTVNDYTLSNDLTDRTLFSWRYDYTATGEFDGTIEMMEYYYDFYKDYRISMQSLPLESLTGEELIASLEKYYDEITSYTILQEPGWLAPNLVAYGDRVKEQVLTIASISSPDKNYLDKAMFYYIDEPRLWEDEGANGYKANLTRIQQVDGFLEDCVQTIKSDHTGKYDSFKKIKNWEQFVLEIPKIMPLQVEATRWVMAEADTEKGKEMLSRIHCLCPSLESFTEDDVITIKEICKQYNLELWWYGAWIPLDPAPNYHIGTESALAPRTLSWLQKKYDIVVNLYWDTAGYVHITEDYYLDVYENPVRWSQVTAGDGILTYPGEEYGVYGPIPTIRLMAIRDGMEEYEMLADLENQYVNMVGVYGKDFQVATYMDTFYDSIYHSGYFLRHDGENGLDFDALRANLIELLVWNEKGMGFAMSKGVNHNNLITLTYYISPGNKVYIDEQLQQPVSGYKYEYQLNLKENQYFAAVFESEDGTKYEYSTYIAEPVTILNTVDSGILEYITVNDASTVELAQTGEYSSDGTSVHMQVNGVVTGREAIDAGYLPFASIDMKALQGISKLTDLSEMSLDIYNPGADFTMKLRIYSGTKNVDAGEYKIKSGMNTITIRVNSITFAELDKADRIAFEFSNTDDGQTANKYEFYIDNVIGK